MGRRGTAPTDLVARHEQYREALDAERLGALADQLGVSSGALNSLQIGWSVDKSGWTLPMRDAGGELLGFRIRLPNGKKLTLRGTREGLFIPTGLSASDLLFVTEGPTDCAALLGLGLPAVGRPSCTGGVQEVLAFVRERRVGAVVVVADNDEPGQRGAKNLALALKNIASTCVITPPAGDMRAWVQSAEVGAADVMDLVEKAREPSGDSEARHSQAEQDALDDVDLGPLPSIVTTGRQLRHLANDSLRALRAQGSATQPAVYRRHGLLVVVVKGAVGHSIETLTPDSLSARLARTANWYRMSQGNAIATVPPARLCADLIAKPSSALPQLDAIASCPLFGANGDLIQSAGYHEDEELLLIDPLEVAPVPESPTAGHLERARATIDELLQGFRFASEADRAHAVGMAITPFVRRLIAPGRTPLHCVEAPTPGSGKGLLCDVLLAPALGADVRVCPFPSKDAELKKTVTSLLLGGAQAVIFDNVPEGRSVDSAGLAALLTTPMWSDRILGVSRMATLPNDAIWLLTANNPSFSTEIARRTVRVRLDPGVERPWEREFELRLPQWAHHNRATLAHAVLVLVRHWMARGRPYDGPQLGSFAAWSQVVGGIVTAAGYQGFLANREELYSTVESEVEDLGPFVACWWAEHGGDPKRVMELADLCQRHELLADRLGGGASRSRSTSLGKLLTGQRGRVIDGLRIELAAVKVKRCRAYQLVPVASAVARRSSTFAERTCAGEGSPGTSSSVEADCGRAANMANLPGGLNAREEESSAPDPSVSAEPLSSASHMPSPPGLPPRAKDDGPSPCRGEPPAGEVREESAAGSLATPSDEPEPPDDRAEPSSCDEDEHDEQDFGFLGPQEAGS